MTDILDAARIPEYLLKTELYAGGSFYGGLDDGGALLAPERNMSYEAGVKYE